ncbi:MAG: neutral/alkaline non-lysosomal ceramidase N-terminal domain-containing protein, partial [Lentisphaeria bacterium]|nr:neutral/alkaline non-lysosomal ceramidase N-terminal domain-containing protein [Lentisphaeria bacterium]
MKSYGKKLIGAAAAAILLTGCSVLQSDKDEVIMNTDKPIKIGWAKRSIAPENGIAPITGQFYLRVSLGQRTPVLTSAMVLENGSDAVIFVSADMVSVPANVLKSVRETLKKEAPEIPADKIIVNATHTHAGPSAAGPEDTPYPNTVDFIKKGKMTEFIVRQMADAVKEAWAKRDFGSISYGYGHAMTGYSRRSVYLDDVSKRDAGRPGIAMNGHAKMYGRTNDDMFDGYEAGTDTFINLMYTFDKNGKLTGAVINVPCPSQTCGTVWELHASFWHNVREKLAAKYGDITIITQSAAAGDLCPQQLHYLQAEKRRFALKYPEMLKAYMADPFKYPEGLFPKKENYDAQYAYDCMEYLRAEDIAQRITEAFDEVLSWAGKEKFASPELKHEIKTLKLARRQFPKELVDQERRNLAKVMDENFITEGNKYYV